jgi:hypothetical protein
MRMYVAYVWLHQQMEITNNVEILLNYYINKEHNRNEYIINDCCVYKSLNLLNYYHIQH